MRTSRERPKSAPYLRLKNSKRTQNKSTLFYSTRIRIFLKSPVSRIVSKNVKGDPLGVFQHPFFCKIEKIEGGPFGDIKKMRKKSHKAEKTCKKNWPSARLEPTSFCLADLKNPQKIRSRSYTSVAVSGSHFVKLIKSVTSLVFKKVATIVCVFLRKAPTKKTRNFSISCSIHKKRRQFKNDDV